MLLPSLREIKTLESGSYYKRLGGGCNADFRRRSLIYLPLTETPSPILNVSMEKSKLDVLGEVLLMEAVYSLMELL